MSATLGMSFVNYSCCDVYLLPAWLYEEETGWTFDPEMTVQAIKVIPSVASGK